MSREAMQLALEALELYQSKSSVQMFDDAVKALRQALETGQEPVAWMYINKDGAVKTYTVQELADSKGVSAPVRGALLGMQEKLARYIKIHDAVVADADKAHALLRWAETEMRYAGWDTRLNDQHGRTDVYEAIVEFLK